jgi:hypothetical protein
MDQNLLLLAVPCFSRPRKIPTSLEKYDLPAMAAEEHSGKSRFVPINRIKISLGDGLGESFPVRNLNSMCL